jgi:hypothetical protein
MRTTLLGLSLALFRLTTATSSKKKNRKLKKHRPLSGGAIAGIVIGAIALVVIIALIIFFALRVRRGKRKDRLQCELDMHRNVAPPQYTPPPPGVKYRHEGVPGGGDAYQGSAPVEMMQPSEGGLDKTGHGVGTERRGALESALVK